MSQEPSSARSIPRLRQGGVPGPAVLTTQQAAAYLGVAVGTLRTWRHRECGPRSFRMQGRVVYRLSALDAYLDECEAADSAPMRHRKGA
ncbi:helix-turn-helix transcriptional regulator [Streptomyces boncukensis]|uniref:Helix-turn-helix domain-containing protein n=1 Tax=Streptomyces boncukensis TaxID=2711219 RepID=A0A6G4WQN4_9ACTN|nr:helix-turn-helix domain-containing protein [Streptomyces boncukensis]NGO67142.1 helix-turn-helix domain-containing protein [Streptomyces boncukensis]